MTETYITTDSHIRFYDRDCANEYADAEGEAVEIWRTVNVCRASEDFMALSYTTEQEYVGTFDPSGFQI